MISRQLNVSQSNFKVPKIFFFFVCVLFEHTRWDQKLRDWSFLFLILKFEIWIKTRVQLSNFDFEVLMYKCLNNCLNG